MPKVPQRALVTGSTGNIGHRVARLLLDKGFAVRAFARDPDKAKRMIGDGAEIFVGDFLDAISLASAMEGVDRVFLACGNVPGQLNLEGAVIDAAKEGGIGRIVKLSAYGASVGAPLSFWKWHGHVEAYLAASGIPSVVLQPMNSMSNLLTSAEAVRREGVIVAPAEGARIAMIHPDDVAEVAAEALSSGYEGQTLVLSGPKAVTFDEVAEQMSQVIGRPVGFVPVSDEAARGAMLGAGLPDDIVDFLIGLFQQLRNGAHDLVSPAVSRLTGSAGRPVGDFIRENLDAFKG